MISPKIDSNLAHRTFANQTTDTMNNNQLKTIEQKSADSIYFSPKKLIKIKSKKVISQKKNNEIAAAVYDNDWTKRR